MNVQNENDNEGNEVKTNGGINFVAVFDVIGVYVAPCREKKSKYKYGNCCQFSSTFRNPFTSL